VTGGASGPAGSGGEPGSPDRTSGSGDAGDRGRWLVDGGLAGTGVFVVAAVAAAVVPGALAGVAAVVSLVLFVAGCVLMLLAFFVAVGRSREEVIAVGGLYFLAGCAPRAVQVRLMGALAAQVVVAVATASVRPFSPLAFGVLVPVYGLGIAGLWAARHGSFPSRHTLGGEHQPPGSEEPVPDQTE
jgi:hypothetical protein